MNAALSILVEWQFYSAETTLGVHERREVIRSLGHNCKFRVCCTLLKTRHWERSVYVRMISDTDIWGYSRSWAVSSFCSSLTFWEVRANNKLIFYFPLPQAWLNYSDNVGPFLKQLQRQFKYSSLYVMPADSSHLRFVENFFFNTQGWVTCTPTYIHIIRTPSLSVVLDIPLASRILTLLASAVWKLLFLQKHQNGTKFYLL